MTAKIFITTWISHFSINLISSRTTFRFIMGLVLILMNMYCSLWVTLQIPPLTSVASVIILWYLSVSERTITLGQLFILFIFIISIIVIFVLGYTHTESCLLLINKLSLSLWCDNSSCPLKAPQIYLHTTMIYKWYRKSSIDLHFISSPQQAVIIKV